MKLENRNGVMIAESQGVNEGLILLNLESVLKSLDIPLSLQTTITADEPIKVTLTYDLLKLRVFWKEIKRKGLM